MNAWGFRVWGQGFRASEQKKIIYAVESSFRVQNNICYLSLRAREVAARNHNYMRIHTHSQRKSPQTGEALNRLGLPAQSLPGNPSRSSLSSTHSGTHSPCPL